MVDSLAENARRSFWDEWTKIACPTLVVLGRSGITPRGRSTTCSACDRIRQP
ncbi:MULTISPECIES: hypothetical protein [Nocardiopsis]|uniref:hypothetical protein n=1 Tax=Nocardiopsis TaxID=2013 RepID=UPI000A7D941A|nr:MULTISPECIES: hypothetical protein [Nocardiopsis]